MKNKFLGLLVLGLSLTSYAMPATDKPALANEVVVVNQDQQLIEAARAGHVERLKKLLKARADVNTLNNLQQTPLHLACQDGNDQCVTVLLAYKADVNKVDSFRKTPLQYAIERPCYTNFGKINVENSSQRDIVDGLEIVKLLVEQGGANLSIPNCPSLSLSRWAAIKGHREIAEYLKTMEDFLKDIPDSKQPEEDFYPHVPAQQASSSSSSSSTNSSLSEDHKRKRAQDANEQPDPKRPRSEKEEVTSDDDDENGKEEEAK